MRCLAFLALFVSLPASAKDLRGRFGAGFDTQLAPVPTVSARYGIPTGNAAVNIHAEAALGLAPNTSVAGGRLMYGVVAEDNLNLYLGAGIAAVTTNEVTVFRVQPGVTVDFFLFGLENLGLSLGWGLNADLGDATAVSTSASVGAGAHYWF